MPSAAGILRVRVSIRNGAAANSPVLTKSRPANVPPQRLPTFTWSAASV